MDWQGLAGDTYVADSEEDHDDIARFERQCAERARAEGLMEEEECRSDQEDDQRRKAHAKLVSGSGPSPKDADGWRVRCTALQEKLARREAELAQARSDLDLLRSDSVGPGDVNTELKQRLMDLTKKNRRMQVTVESQKTRLQQLEAELKKPREELKKQVEEIILQNNNAVLGDGMVEDWKKKFLAASNSLQQVRHESQELRVQLQKQRKVLLKELGADDAVEKALAVADDPNSALWRGRAAQISQLQRQLRELKESIAAGQADPNASLGSDPGEPTLAPPRAARAREQVPEKERAAISQAAEKRREEFERLQEEAERLRTEHNKSKQKLDAIKSRNSLLETQLRELKAHIQFLLRKSDDDSALVEVLRRQVGRGARSEDYATGELPEVEALRQENAELQGQLERQAQIVLHLRQKSLAAACENGSAKLGPGSVESSTSERQLVERIRFLEAENAKLTEQVRILQGQLGEDRRPFSAESSVNLKEQLRKMSAQLAHAERENVALRQREEDRRDSSPGSCSSCQASLGANGRPGGQGPEQVQRQNEALKKEILRLRAAMSAQPSAFVHVEQDAEEDND